MYTVFLIRTGLYTLNADRATPLTHPPNDRKCTSKPVAHCFKQTCCSIQKLQQNVAKYFGLLMRCFRSFEIYRSYTYTKKPTYTLEARNTRKAYCVSCKVIHNKKGQLINKMPWVFVFSYSVYFFIKGKRKSMCWRIYTRLLNVPWQAPASCVSRGTALWVFVIHSLHTP